jgi:NAD(P)-dependent dehydrogenase (short-subunit alcohol dehydrogenase family)
MPCARREEWLLPTVEEFRGRGFKAEGILCDVANAEQVQAVVDATVGSYGRVDILINNAGVSWGERPEKCPSTNGRRSLTLTSPVFSVCAGGRARDAQA